MSYSWSTRFSQLRARDKHVKRTARVCSKLKTLLPTQVKQRTSVVNGSIQTRAMGEDTESLEHTFLELGTWLPINYVVRQYKTDNNLTDKIYVFYLNIFCWKMTVNQANKDGDIETLRHFKVALSHVTQLSHLLAFYFGLRLPKKVNQMDFMRSDLDPKRFAGRLARLHMNM